MKITNQMVAQKLIDYLYHRITLTELVDWSESVMMDDDFEEDNFEMLREIVSRLGLADVKAFMMSWEDCEEFLLRLGYQVSIKITEKQVMA